MIYQLRKNWHKELAGVADNENSSMFDTPMAVKSYWYGTSCVFVLFARKVQAADLSLWEDEKFCRSVVGGAGRWNRLGWNIRWNMAEANVIRPRGSPHPGNENENKKSRPRREVRSRRPPVLSSLAFNSNPEVTRYRRLVVVSKYMHTCIHFRWLFLPMPGRRRCRCFYRPPSYCPLNFHRTRVNFPFDSVIHGLASPRLSRSHVYFLQLFF